MTVLNLGHVGLTCYDLDRSEEFYSEIFSFQAFFRVRRTAPWLAAQVGYKNADVEFCHMRHPSAGIHLELLKYHAPAGHTLPDDSFHPGHVHFNLWVDDVEAYARRLNNYFRSHQSDPTNRARFAPCPLDIEASTISDGPQKGGKGYYIRDPDGHTIELWQQAPSLEGQAFGR